MNAEKTGAFIRALRNEKHMTQEELAEKLHVSRAAVSKWERGIGLPDVSILEDLADALDISVTELMHGQREEIMETNEQDYRQLSRSAKIEVEETSRKIRNIFLILLAGIAVILLVSGIYYRRRPTFTLINHNAYEGVYNISGSQYQLTEYFPENGKAVKSSTVSTGFQGITHVNASKTYGIEFGGSYGSDIIPEKGYDADAIPLQFNPSLQASEEEQILAIDADHDINENIEDLQKEDHLYMVTIRYKRW